MIRKYQNELIVLAALLFLLVGFVYQRTARIRLDVATQQAHTATQEITETTLLQQVWSSKGLKKKVEALRAVLPAAKVERFDLGKEKLDATFTSLTSQELNALSSQIASLPVRIQTFNVSRTGESYTVGCKCSW